MNIFALFFPFVGGHVRPHRARLRPDRDVRCLVRGRSRQLGDSRHRRCGAPRRRGPPRVCPGHELRYAQMQASVLGFFFSPECALVHTCTFHHVRHIMYGIVHAFYNKSHRHYRQPPPQTLLPARPRVRFCCVAPLSSLATTSSPIRPPRTWTLRAGSTR